MLKSLNIFVVMTFYSTFCTLIQSHLQIKVSDMRLFYLMNILMLLHFSTNFVLQFFFVDPARPIARTSRGRFFPPNLKNDLVILLLSFSSGICN